MEKGEQVCKIFKGVLVNQNEEAMAKSEYTRDCFSPIDKIDVKDHVMWTSIGNKKEEGKPYLASSSSDDCST